MGRAGETGIFDRVPVLSAAALELSIALVLGWIALRLSRVLQGMRRAEQFVFSLGVGCNLLSLATLLAGLCGLLRPNGFRAAGASILICGALLVRRDWRIRRSQAEIPARRWFPPSAAGGEPRALA